MYPTENPKFQALTNLLDLFLTLPTMIVGMVWGIIVLLLLVVPVFLFCIIRPAYAKPVGLWLRDRVALAIRGDWEQNSSSTSEL